MTLSLFIFWVALVSFFAVGAAYYARKYERSDALMALYVTLVIASNLVASKIIGFNLGFTTLFAPSATLLFSVTFLLSDIVNERFGRREAQRMVWLAVAAQLAFLIFTYMALIATPAPFFQNQAAFEAVFAQAPRVAFAGLFTFLISESLGAYLYAWFKVATGGRWLWTRNVFSSAPAMALDSALFVTLAFYGVQPLVPLIIGLTVIKWLVGVIDVPFMYLARAIMRSKTAQ